MNIFVKTILISMMANLFLGCTGGGTGGGGPTPSTDPVVTITIDGGGQILHNGQICTQALSPCKYPTSIGQELQYSVFPTEEIAFYSWERCSSPQGTKCFHTVSGSVNILAHFGPIITITPNPPPDPTLSLKDAVTSSTLLLRQNNAQATVTNDSTAVKWCLSETQVLRPTTGSITCSGSDPTGDVDENGWHQSRPSSIRLSSGNGPKTVYLWVANGTNEVNIHQVSASITVDAQSPAIPTVKLSDTATGSFVATTSATVNLSITQDANANAWCIYEQASSAAAPVRPSYNSPCWSGSKPSQIALGALGQRSVYVYTKSLAQNVSTGPGVGSINYSSVLPTLTLDEPSAFEGSPVTFTITQSFPSTAPTTVHYSTEDGTGVAGVNYVAKSGTASIPAGQLSATVTIATIDDHVHTANKTFSLKLDSSTNSSLATGSSTAILYDIDAGPVISLSSASSIEGQPLIFTVTQSEISEFDTNFTFTSTDGTAINGTNYTARSGSFRILAGQLSTTISVATIDDNFYTPNLTVLASISNPTNATLGAFRSLGITNNANPIPTLTITTSPVVESVPLTFTVTQSALTGFDTTVRFATSDDSAISGVHYESNAGLLIIPQGTLSKTFQINTLDAGIYAPDKVLKMTLSAPSHATVPSAVMSATIKNGHERPSISVIPTSAVKGQNLKFTVLQSQVTGYATTFSYQTSDGTATDGAQYTGRVGTATIPIGAQTTTVLIPTQDDGVYSLPKNMTLRISNPQFAVLGAETASGSIVSSGGAALSVSDESVDEGGNINFAITLSSAISNDVRVDYATGDDTAIGGFNYTSKVGSLVIPAGSTSAVLSVKSLHDDRFALTRTMKLFLIGSPDAPITKNIGVGSIRNIDPMPSLTISSASAPNGTDLVFTVTQSKVSGANTSFNFNTSNGTAVSGLNYAARSLVGSIIAGQLSTTIAVTTFDNGFFGPTLSMNLNLSAPLNATISSAVGTGTIVNTYGTPVVSIGAASAVEGRDLKFQISLSALSVVDTTVRVVTADGSAVGYRNFFPKTQTVTIPAGTKTVEFVVNTIDANIFEQDQQMIVNLSNVTNAILGQSNAIGTIRNNHGIPYLSLPMRTQANEGSVLQFIITQSNTYQSATKVKYRTRDNSATAPKNYIETIGEVTIPAGQLTAVVNVPTVDDHLYSFEKTFFLELYEPTNAIVDTVYGIESGFITNVNPKPTIVIPEISVVEGQELIFTASLSSPSDLGSAFRFETKDNSAFSRINYDTSAANLYIPAGETSVRFAVTTIDDLVYTPTKKLELKLTELANVDLATTPYYGNLTNADLPPTVSIADASGNEGTPIEFTITQDNVSGFNTTISYSTSNDTAIAGLQYTATVGTAVIPAGSTTAKFSVPTVDEGVYAPVKKFKVAISNPINASVQAGSAVGTISNNHSAPTLFLSDAETTEDSDLVFLVTQSSVSSLATTFNYTTVDSTGVAGTNYVAKAGSATIPAGSKTVEIRISTIQDFLNTPAKTVNLVLSNPVNANFVNSTGVGTIGNIDGTPNISIANVQVDEGSPLLFTVTSSSVSGADVTVSYQTSDNTAESPADYTAKTGTVTIPRGSKTATISVSSVRDGFYSLSKNMKITLSSPVNANIITAVATGTIRNTDPMPVLSVAGASATDGQPLFFLATLSAKSKVDTIVNFVTVDGTAIANQDYAFSQGTLFIPAGELSNSIAFLTYDLREYGPTLHLRVDLSNVTNATLATTSVQGFITNHYPPQKPSLAVSDTVTGSYSLTNNIVVRVDVGDSYGVKWCLASSALAKPVNGSDACQGGATGAGISNGWHTTRPTSYTMPDGDGQKEVYLWISDSLNKVSDASIANIILETALPATPSVKLSDPRTGSETLTNRSNPTLTITGDTSSPIAVAWCVVEQADSIISFAPAKPSVDSTCWKTVRPTSQPLGDLGQRDVYVFTKSLAQNVSEAGSASIEYSAQPPADPTLLISDATTGSGLYVRQRSVNLAIGNDSTAVKWCVSESQSVRPSSSLAACAGGQGSELGWSTQRPTTYTVSANEELKRIYLWVVDDVDNVNLNTVSNTITLETTLPTIASVTLQDPNTLNASSTNKSIVSLIINNDVKANAWLVIEASAAASTPVAPLYNDPRWSSTRPTTLQLSQIGSRKAFLWTLSAAFNVSLVSTTNLIDYQISAPSPVAFTLKDSSTQTMSDYTATRLVSVSTSSSPSTARWCLSEIQMMPPTLGTDMCLGGTGLFNGWSSSPPTEYQVSSGDGLKTIYLWVANQYNNVSQANSIKQINLNTTVPLTPIIVLTDPNTGSNTETNLLTVNLEVTGDTGATGWCVFDQDQAVAAPTAAPIHTSSCWVSVRPTTVTMTGTSFRNIYVFTRNNAKTPSATFATARMDNSNQPPSTPTLALFDPTTLSSTRVRQNSSGVTISALQVVRYCLSETQSTKPATGTSVCNGGGGSSNGWYPTRPSTIPLSNGDGTKKVYLWVANSHNNVSTTSVSATITVDTVLPARPIVVIKDPVTLSTTSTTAATSSLTITGDTSSPIAIAWCTIEQDSTYTIPNSPNFDSSCWKTSRPTTQVMSTYGSRTVYVFTKSTAQNISLPGSATISYGPPPPITPYFYMYDQVTSSSTYSQKNTVLVGISSDAAAVKWCFSELQTTRPASGSSECVGGGGAALGWYTTKPLNIPTSPGDGVKKVYFWVADQYNNTNVTPYSYTITVSTAVPSTPVVQINDPNTQSTTQTNRSVIPVAVTNTTGATAYCIFETAAGAARTPPVHNEYCWTYNPGGNNPPTSVTLSTTGNRQVWVYSKSISGLVSLPGTAQINFTLNGPSDPTLKLSDPVTAGPTYARQRLVKATITNDLGAVKWCLSESQNAIPASGSAPCVGGEGPDNGWYTSRPNTVTLGATDPDYHYINLWIANAAGNVNIGSSGTHRDNMYLDSVAPVTATNFAVRDPVTGSSSTTNKSSINVSYSAGPKTSVFCMIERAAIDPAPAAPAWNDPCWNTYYYQLTTWTVAAQGQRQFYLFAMSAAKVVQTTPATATINVTTTAPANPTDYYLYDPSTGSRTTLRSRNIYVYYATGTGISKWCLSEIQTTKPENGSATCAGGLGSANGWHTSATNNFTVSAGDGNKTVYLWLADSFDNVSLTAATASAVLQIPVLPTQPIVSFTEAGVTKTTLKTSPGELKIANDTNAVKWCVLERLINTGIPSAPAATNECWVSTRPTTWAFVNPHTPVYIVVYTKSVTGDVSQAGYVNVTYDMAPPNSPTLVLKDPVTGSSLRARQSSALAVITNDSSAVKWCLSETQTTRPATGISNCVGGAGNYKGWFTQKPSFISLSAGNSTKTVYLWIADAWDYTNIASSSASIAVSPASVVAPTVTVFDRATLSNTTTNSGQITATVTNPSSGTAWCFSEQAHGSGTPVQPLPTSSCWIASSSLDINLQVSGSRDVFVFAKDAAGNISATPGMAMIQFGVALNLISSTSVADGAQSPLLAPIFNISNSALYFAYKNANQALDCMSDGDPLHPYSSILTNSAPLSNNVLNMLDGDIYLCVNAITDPYATPNYATTRYYHWVKQALWKEKAFLKAPSSTPGASFGDSLEIYNNYLIVADSYSSNNNVNGNIFIYSISANNTVSLVTSLSGGQFGGYSYNVAGLGSRMAVSNSGQLAAIGSNGQSYIYIFDIPKIAAGGAATSNVEYVYTNPNNYPAFTNRITGNWQVSDIAFDPANPNTMIVGYSGAYGGIDNIYDYKQMGGIGLFKFNTTTKDWEMDSYYATSDLSIEDANIGTKIAIYNGTIVSGAPGKVSAIASGTQVTGGVYVWKVPANSQGTINRDPLLLQGSSNPALNHVLGNSVAIYYDSILKRNVIMAGDPKDSTNGIDSGAVYYWTQDSAGGYSVAPVKLLSQNSKVTQAGALFGSSIKVGGNHIVISAPGTSGLNTSTTVWNYENGFVEKASLSSAISQYAGAGFGTAIAVSPQYILIGSPEDTTTNPVSTGVLITPPSGTDGASLGGVSIFNGYQ